MSYAFYFAAVLSDNKPLISKFVILISEKKSEEIALTKNGRQKLLIKAV